MQISVTGATGFIGSPLCARLRQDGHAVRVLSRSGAAPAGLEIVRGDLADPAALDRLVDGAEAVLHLAAAVRGRSASDFDEPNVAGTRRVLDSLDRRAPDAALLFMSSLAASEPTLSFYAASKHAAENEVASRRSGRATLVLRPPAVYGEGDTEMLPVFRFMARTGLAPCAGKPTQRLSLIHVDDLVAAIAAWLPIAARTQATLCLHDGQVDGYDWPQLASTVGRVCGRTVRVWQIPSPALDAVARLNSWLSALSGRAPMLTPAKLRELRHRSWVCNEDPRRVLPGWSAHIDLETGLRQTPGWR